MLKMQFEEWTVLRWMVAGLLWRLLMGELLAETVEIMTEVMEEIEEIEIEIEAMTGIETEEEEVTTNREGGLLRTAPNTEFL
jgi:flavoprotein